MITEFHLRRRPFRNATGNIWSNRCVQVQVHHLWKILRLKLSTNEWIYFCSTAFICWQVQSNILHRWCTRSTIHTQRLDQLLPVAFRSGRLRRWNLWMIQIHLNLNSLTILDYNFNSKLAQFQRVRTLTIEHTVSQAAIKIHEHWLILINNVA